MSGISLTYDINLELPQRLLRQLEHAQTSELMEGIGHYVVQATQLNFDNEQTPDGEPWEPSYRAKNNRGKTLTGDTERLRDSYTHNVLSDTQVEIGSNMLYAAIHHDGGTITGKDGNLKFKIGNQWINKKSVEMPARPALGINADDEDEIQALTTDFLQDLLNVH